MLEKRFFSHVIAISVIIILAVIIPFIFSEYILYVLVLAYIQSILALSYDIPYGRAGILNFYWGIPYGIGAYLSALINLNFGVPVFLSMLISALIIAGMSFLIAAASLRIFDFFFWVATWGMVFVAATIVRVEADVTGGPMGLRGINKPEPIGNISFSSTTNYYYLTLIFLSAVIFIVYLVSRSKFGKLLIAIREDQILAECLGVNTYLYKILAFSLGTFLASLAGGLYAHFYTYLAPTIVETSTIQILAYSIIGGVGTLFGPLIGALLITFIMELFRLTAELRLLILGITTILMILLFPRGIIGLYKAVREKKKVS